MVSTTLEEMCLKGRDLGVDFGLFLFLPGYSVWFSHKEVLERMALLINFFLVYLYIYFSYPESARLNFGGESKTNQCIKSSMTIYLEIPSKMAGLHKKPREQVYWLLTELLCIPWKGESTEECYLQRIDLATWHGKFFLM